MFLSPKNFPHYATANERCRLSRSAFRCWQQKNEQGSLFLF
jgi:hypothetical protein